ncbi:TPA: hypothetical protein ACQDQ8_004826 [Serratia marcescens]
MTIDRILSISSIIVSCVAVPASGYLSYHFAIRGEKRKEFNAVSDPIRQKLREQLRLIDQDYSPRDRNASIEEKEFDLFVDVSRTKNRKRLQQLFADYHQAMQNCGSADEYGKFTYTDKVRLLSAIRSIISYAERN